MQRTKAEVQSPHGHGKNHGHFGGGRKLVLQHNERVCGMCCWGSTGANGGAALAAENKPPCSGEVNSGVLIEPPKENSMGNSS
jgi:hypothetical protein